MFLMFLSCLEKLLFLASFLSHFLAVLPGGEGLSRLVLLASFYQLLGWLVMLVWGEMVEVQVAALSTSLLFPGELVFLAFCCCFGWCPLVHPTSFSCPPS